MESYSPEQRVIVNGENIGKKVIATCNSGYGKQEILKKEGQNLWCGTRLTDVCSRKKVAAAELVCTRSYQRKSALLNTALETDNEKQRFTTLKEELIEIEKQRLEIAEKLLNLKRREIVLKNRI